MSVDRARFRFISTACLLSLILSSSVSGSPPTVAIYNIPPTPHFAKPETSLDQIENSLRRSALIQGWTVTKAEQGSLTAQLWVREKHLAIVRIGFDEVYFWISYLDSKNLNYKESKNRLSRGRREKIKGPFIHPNYNLWVKGLSSTIRKWGIQSNSDTVGDRSRSSDVPLIADELRKLNSLREEGLLTQEEFEQQKRRLLSD